MRWARGGTETRGWRRFEPILRRYSHAAGPYDASGQRRGLTWRKPGIIGRMTAQGNEHGGYQVDRLGWRQ